MSLSDVAFYTQINNISAEETKALLNNFHQPSLEALFVSVATGDIFPVAVAKFLDPQLHRSNNLPVKGTGGVPYTFAQCCLPIPGDDIIAHLAQGRGLVIHNINCRNLRQSDKDPSKSLKVRWDLAVTANMEFRTGILVELENRQGIVSEISNAIDIAGSRIESINSDIKDEKTFMMNLIVTVRDRLHLAGVIRHIKAVPNVISIHRRR